MIILVIIYITLVKFVDVVVDALKDALIIGNLKACSCKVCGKPTSSEPGLCRAHVKGYYVMKCLYGQNSEVLSYRKIYTKDR